MYVEQYIQPGKLSDYVKYIPKNYHAQILNGDLSVIATYDGEESGDEPIGVMVLADHQKWFEIVWVYVCREYRTEVKSAEYLRHCLRQAAKTRRYIGAFCEVQVEEEKALHSNVMVLAGMELLYAKNNVYELRLSQIRHRNTLFHAAEGTECIPLSDVDEDILEFIEEQIASDKRPIPFPADVNWESYDEDLSRICVIDDEPAGILLFSHAAEYVVLELAYSVSERALPAMIGSALGYAEQNYSPEQKILIPVVGTGISDIINRMVPDVIRGDALQAVIWFEDAPVKPAMQRMLDQMLA